LNQRVIIQNSMVENMGNSSIKNNNITEYTISTHQFNYIAIGHD